jgi:protein TonB
MPVRPLFAAICGALTAFGLFWVMQALISVDYKLKEGGTKLSVDFVRLKRDIAPETKKREPPKREKPEQQPAPPQMNVAKNMNPADAVGEIVPIVDTGMELEKATSLGAGGGGDSGITPLVRIEPEYPPRAKEQGIEGWVELEFTISPVGTVEDAVVTRAKPRYVFDQAALRAVRKWRYSPRTEGGVAVARPGVQVRLRFEIPRGR